jgi:NADH-quinone oxidoreductase subunit L
MVDLAILIPVLPALGWLIISIFSKALGSKGSAWLATSLMALSAAIAIGLFVEISSAAPNWKAEPLEQLYTLEHKAKTTEAAKPAETPAVEGVEPITALTEEADKKAELLREALPSSNRALSGFPFVREWSWLSIKGEAGLPFGLYLDQTAGIVVLMVSIVAFLIHLFSVGYMAGEERYATFFAYINLFAAAMLAMVMAKNLFHVLLFWEIMGVMSYLLIGFFYKKKTAQQAMKKAFMTVRVGDLAFMAGLFWLYSSFKTLDIPTILEAGASGELLRVLGVTAAGGIGLLLFIAAMGKSAQFPLHVWLADAMEGPTPVSAMIHAATMVAAGVYLVARAYPILEIGHVLPFVALIGGFTAIFAASMAPAQADAKKIMAFSSCRSVRSVIRLRCFTC